MSVARSSIVTMSLALAIAQPPPAQADDAIPNVDRSCTARGHAEGDLQRIFKHAQQLAKNGYDEYLSTAFERGNFNGYEVPFGRYDLVGTDKWRSVGDFPEAVRARARRVRDSLVNWRFTIYCYDPDLICKESGFPTGELEDPIAYVRKADLVTQDPEIYLCEQFWRLPEWHATNLAERNQWSEEGVFIHEAGHFQQNLFEHADGAGLLDVMGWEKPPKQLLQLVAAVQKGYDKGLQSIYDSAAVYQVFFERDPSGQGVGCSAGGPPSPSGTAAMSMLLPVLALLCRHGRRTAPLAGFACVAALAGCATSRLPIAYAPSEEPVPHPHPEALVCDLHVPAQVELGTDLPVTLTLKNVGTESLHLLMDATTLLLPQTDPLDMECDGRTVTSTLGRVGGGGLTGYDSPAMRGAFRTIRPGEQYTVTMDALAVYRPPVANRCTVNMKPAHVFVTDTRLNGRGFRTVYAMPLQCKPPTFMVRYSIPAGTAGDRESKPARPPEAPQQHEGR